NARTLRWPASGSQAPCAWSSRAADSPSKWRPHMTDALLVLCDSSILAGGSVGVSGIADGEVVFNTSMTGYQEMLTDPSYAGQLLTLTYPLIGNYGLDETVEESGRIQPAGLIVREASVFASHLRSQ